MAVRKTHVRWLSTFLWPTKNLSRAQWQFCWVADAVFLIDWFWINTNCDSWMGERVWFWTSPFESLQFNQVMKRIFKLFFSSWRNSATRFTQLRLQFIYLDVNAAVPFSNRSFIGSIEEMAILSILPNWFYSIRGTIRIIWLLSICMANSQINRWNWLSVSDNQITKSVT